MDSGRARLRDWMDRHGVNQTKAAEILEVNYVVLSQYLNGKRIPGLVNAVKIEQVTGISVESWLLNRVSPAVEPQPSDAGNSDI